MTVLSKNFVFVNVPFSVDFALVCIFFIFLCMSTVNFFSFLFNCWLYTGKVYWVVICGDLMLLCFVLSDVLGQCRLPSERFLCLRSVRDTLHIGVRRNGAAEGYETISRRHLGMLGGHGLCLHLHKRYCYSVGSGKGELWIRHNKVCEWRLHLFNYGHKCIAFVKKINRKM